MNTQNEKQLKATVSLGSNSDFQVFMEWILESQVMLALASASMGREPERTWAQGKIQALGLIVKAVSDARANLEGLENNKQGG